MTYLETGTAHVQHHRCPGVTTGGGEGWSSIHATYFIRIAATELAIEFVGSITWFSRLAERRGLWSTKNLGGYLGKFMGGLMKVFSRPIPLFCLESCPGPNSNVTWQDVWLHLRPRGSCHHVNTQ